MTSLAQNDINALSLPIVLDWIGIASMLLIFIGKIFDKDKIGLIIAISGLVLLAISIIIYIMWLGDYDKPPALKSYIITSSLFIILVLTIFLVSVKIPNLNTNIADSISAVLTNQ